jgi:hypothetical protein
MYTMYIAGIGEVHVYKDALHRIGTKTYILGYDSARQPIRFTVDRIYVPKDRPGECGYCHITSYTQGTTVTQCNIYKAIH